MAESNVPVERWLPVVDWEDSHEVSDQGRVRSVDRPVTLKNGKIRWQRGRVLAQWATERGHLNVQLCAEGRSVHAKVHRLVLIAFVGLPPEGTECCHGEAGPSVNWLYNLRWDTQSENMLDRGRHGTDYQRNKTHCPRNHLLQKPNLIPWHAKRGIRGCLACSRTFAAAGKAKKYGRSFDFQVEADHHYVKIMGQAGQIGSYGESEAVVVASAGPIT